MFHHNKLLSTAEALNSLTRELTQELHKEFQIQKRIQTHIKKIQDNYGGVTERPIRPEMITP